MTKVSFPEIGKITDKFSKQLKTQVAQLADKPSPQVIHFSVVIDGGTIKLTSPKTSGSSLKETKVSNHPFDPREAGRNAVEQLKNAEGGAWTRVEMEAHFNLSPATLYKRRAEHRIIFWKDAKNQFHYPKWQFNDAGATLEGVQEVLQTFQSSDEWRVMRYFLAPRHQLGDATPLSLLRAGKLKDVVDHAKAHAEENSW